MEERLNREGIPAGRRPRGLDLRDASWSAPHTRRGRIHLSFSVGLAALDLDLDPATPPVVFGENGVTRKGADPAAASHYLTFPRLASAGTLRLSGREDAVQGQSWMDHEFSSGQLAPGQVGWDWAGIQLRDGRSLMVYRLRGADGAQDPWSTLTEVDAGGRIRRTTRAFQLDRRLLAQPRLRRPLPPARCACGPGARPGPWSPWWRTRNCAPAWARPSPTGRAPAGCGTARAGRPETPMWN